MKPQLHIRLWHYLQREVLRRHLPHGLLGPAYFWPGQNELVLQHRRIWWHSGTRWPRIIWCGVELFLWLRWIFRHAIPNCQKVTGRLAPVVEAEEDIPRKTQFRRILKLALLWSIPPSESYQYRLYREPHKALDYVFLTETQAYHSWRNEALGYTPASSCCLQSKDRLANRLSNEGIPVVKTIAKVAMNDKQTRSLNNFIDENGRVFCKMNSGNQGRGAFAAWRAESGLKGHCFSGEHLVDTAAVEQAWKNLLQLDTVLVQPCLQNHPTLAPLAWNDEIITIRYISQWQKSAVASAASHLSCLCATLEVPAGVNEKNRTCYAILQINPTTGLIESAIKEIWGDNRIRERVSHIESLTKQIGRLSGWEQVVAHSHKAHSCFPEIKSIAWDWAMSDEGPLLLEGNVGWGCSAPQIFMGGLLAKQH